MNINLLDIFHLDKIENYKLHLGCYNGNIHPLDEFIKNPSNWKSWNEYNDNNNVWNKPFIFSLIEYYHKKDTWLFGGIFKVIERTNDKYILDEVSEYVKYKGRVLINFHRYKGLRGRGFLLEKYVEKMSVDQILENFFTGESFPGYENIIYSFSALEPIIKTEKSDWKSALKNAKGIYLLIDKQTGQKYIGSAYSNDGIWKRWSQYINTYHGGNIQLKSIVKKFGTDYIKNNFQFSILEIVSSYATKEEIEYKESLWKRKLLSREFGYNLN